MSKQIKIILAVAVFILSLGAILFMAQPTNTDQTTKEPKITTNNISSDKIFHDFGTISMKNGNVKTLFKIINTDDKLIALNKLYTSCMCTTATLIISNTTEGPFGMPGHGKIRSFLQQLNPNQEAEIEVEFDPNAHGPTGVGVIERSVLLENNSGKLLTLQIKANVTP